MKRGLATAAVLAGALTSVPAASADTAVVSATVFTGSAETPGSRTVALSTLGACPPYAGPAALTLYPGGSTDTLAAGTTWTLAEILQCGLSIPLSDLEAADVLRPDGAAQTPLSPAALSDPSQYADPAAPGALPVISNDGGQAQNTYTRPWRGGQDENGRDQVTVSGPVHLLVYENTAPLAVRIAPRVLRRGPRRERVALSATVRTAAGSPVPTSALAWQWTISTGASSTSATPTISVPRGATTVTVLVSEAAVGSGGTASVALPYRPVRSARARTGGGGHATARSTSGLGSGHPSGAATHPAAGRASGATHSAEANPHATTTPAATPPRGATTPPGTPPVTTPPATPAATPRAASPAPKAPTTTPTSDPPPSRSTHRTTRHAAGHGERLVRGRLLADVLTPSAPGSPPIHPLRSTASAAIASPAAARLSPPGAALAGLAVLGLLAVGGAREQRRRSHGLHR